MSIFQTYLENSGSDTQRILDYLSKNAERIDQRPEIKKLLEEIKIQVSKIRTTQTGEKFISEDMKKREKQALETISRCVAWTYGTYLKESNISLKKLNSIFGINISEDRAKDIMFNKFLSSLPSKDKKADKIISTTKAINEAVKNLLKNGKVAFNRNNWKFTDFDFITSPIWNKIMSSKLKLKDKLEIFKTISGKDLSMKDIIKQNERSPLSKTLLNTIERLLKEQK